MLGLCSRLSAPPRSPIPALQGVDDSQRPVGFETARRGEFDESCWVADITYVRLKGRFIYLSLLMDVFTRMIRAWQLSQHLNQSLTLKPLEEALRHSVPEIHHSDQGVQYLSKTYVTVLQAQGVQISVAHRGRPWENGYAERLIRTLKEEEIDSNDYQSLTEARDRIGQFIEHKYHQKRPHSALGGVTPMEFQRRTLS